jgi:hypothetical protein
MSVDLCKQDIKKLFLLIVLYISKASVAAKKPPTSAIIYTFGKKIVVASSPAILQWKFQEIKEVKHLYV